MTIRENSGYWRPEERFNLRKELQSSIFDSPEKQWTLPSYVEKSARRMQLQKSPLLSWGRKGRRSGSKFVDDEAEETDREESSSVSESSSSESSSESGSESGRGSDSGVRPVEKEVEVDFEN